MIHKSDDGRIRCGEVTGETTTDMAKVTCPDCQVLTSYTDMIRAIQEDTYAERQARP